MTKFNTFSVAIATATGRLTPGTSLPKAALSSVLADSKRSSEQGDEVGATGMI
jgi:hypothetical protein